MSEVYLDQRGDLFELQSGKLLPVADQGKSADELELLHRLRRSPYASFYKTPFQRIAYASGNNPLGSFSMTPEDFNPGSPFDAICAAHEYVAGKKLYFPRLYLYPVSVCNSHCRLCQFHWRHKEPSSLTKEDMLEVLRILQHHQGGMQSQSLIVSGDGEPLLYEHLRDLLENAYEMGMRVFLTTNLLKPFESDRSIYQTIARTCRMVTVSIKGLSPEAYAHQQGLPGNHRFEQVMDNLSYLLKMRKHFRKDIIIGVATLILPENTSHYREMIDRLHGMGVDYVYLNQVEPSLERWGIVFSEEERRETLRQLCEYGEEPYHDMVVRCAANPFVQRNGDSVYFDAAKGRKHSDICGSALFNPLVLSKKDEAKWLCCRNGDLFENEEFRYEIRGGEILQSSVEKVMSAASGCRTCRLERQVKHFDRIIDIERSGIQDLQYFLVFDTQRILSGAHSFVSFEKIVE